MNYGTFAAFSRNIGHWVVDNTFPSTVGIATAAGAVSWVSYRLGETFSSEWINGFLRQQFGTISGNMVAVGLTPWLAPKVTVGVSIATGCTTSLFLNQLAKCLCCIKPTPREEIPPPWMPPGFRQGEPVPEPVKKVHVKTVKSKPKPLIITDSPAVRMQVESELEPAKTAVSPRAQRSIPVLVQEVITEQMVQQAAPPPPVVVIPSVERLEVVSQSTPPPVPLQPEKSVTEMEHPKPIVAIADTSSQASQNTESQLATKPQTSQPYKRRGLIQLLFARACWGLCLPPADDKV